MPQHPHVSRQDLRLVAYLAAKDLMGEAVDHPDTARRLIDLTRSVAAVRARIPLRGNVEEDFAASGGRSASLHREARRMAEEAIADHHETDAALAASAELLQSGNCDDLNAALRERHAGHLHANDRLTLVTGSPPPPVLPPSLNDLQRRALQNLSRLNAGGSNHKFHVVASNTSDGTPEVLADPLAGGVRAPEPAVLTKDARADRLQRLTSGTTTVQRTDAEALADSHQEARAFMEQRHGTRARSMLHAGPAADPPMLAAGAWPSQAVFSDTFATRAREAVERGDDARFRRTVVAKIGQVLQVPASTPLVAAVVDEARHFDRVGPAGD